jgi:hypothetical protein
VSDPALALRGLVSSSTTLITYTGRKSGATWSLLLRRPGALSKTDQMRSQIVLPLLRAAGGGLA